jgi:hypothetical protein
MARAVDRKQASRRELIPRAEALEARSVPAAFGLPWGDAGHLTLSFVPDGTPIASHASDLFATLDSRQATAAWQRTVLQAFQSWAVRANINIGLRTDGGQAMGTPGKAQHDPRFGDVRVAAHAMSPEALAISVPGGSLLSGTWVGDMFLNSDVFRGSGAPDLFGVALHEAGHVFGLDNSLDPASPMFSHLSGSHAPTADDVAALQWLFGARPPDRYEGSGGNDTIARAASFPTPSGYHSDRPLVLFADRTTATDVDVYAVKPDSEYGGPMTVRLQSGGISLLAPHLTITDEAGQVLGEAQADSGFGDIVTVRLATVTPGRTYFLRVDSRVDDVLNIGAYGLAVSFEAASTVDPAILDRVLGGEHGTPGPNEADSILRGAARGLLNDDRHTDDAAGEAVKLVTTPGYAPDSHYEATGSISDSTDVDFYRIRSVRAFSGPTGVMTVSIRALDGDAPAPTASILDSGLRPVPARVLANGDGVFTIEAPGIAANSSYYIQVPGGDPSSRPVGNYGLVVDFPRKAADLATFAQGTAGPASSPETFDLFVARSQLFHLLLSAGPAAPPGATVRMIVTRADGTALYSLSTVAGQTASGRALFLTPGAYFLRVVVEGTDQPRDFLLYGQSISDPVGPATVDPTLRPVYTAPGTTKLPPIYAYPGGILTPQPFLILRTSTRAPGSTQPSDPGTTPSTNPGSSGTTSTGPTSQPAITSLPVAGLTAAGRPRRGITAITVGFAGPINSDLARNPALYSLMGGVRRRRRTVFARPLRIRAIGQDATANTVTIELARAYKGPVQVTIHGDLVATGTGPKAGDFTQVVRL